MRRISGAASFPGSIPLAELQVERAVIRLPARPVRRFYRNLVDMRGRVSWYSDCRGYGFIKDDLGTDYFFSHADVVEGQLPRGGDLVDFNHVRAARGWRARSVRIVVRTSRYSVRDDRDTCAHCGKTMVPRMIVVRGRPERTVCPFCGETHREFPRSIWGTVLFIAIFAVVCLGRCS